MKQTMRALKSVVASLVIGIAFSIPSGLANAQAPKLFGQPDVPIATLRQQNDRLQSGGATFRHGGSTLLGFVHLNASTLRPPSSSSSRESKAFVLNLGETLDLQLDIPGGADMHVTLNFEPDEIGWTGDVAGVADSSVTFSYFEGVVAGTIRLPNAEIKIRRVQGDDYAIEKINGQDYPKEAEPLVQQPAEHTFVEDLGRTFGNCEDYPSIITLRVLVLYTDATLKLVGSYDDLGALFTNAVGEANLALKNSNIRVRFVPIAFEKSNVATSTNQDEYLKSLTDDGATKMLRDAQKAHIVSLLDKDFADTTKWAGISWRMTDKNKTKDIGYNIIDWRCALNNLSWIHEVGHNMGAHHNKADAKEPGLFPYSYGLRWPNRFRTIMAYPCDDTGKEDLCSRIARFTNPDIKFSGLFIGDKASANNARTLNQTKCIVSGWYGNSPVPRAFPVEK